MKNIKMLMLLVILLTPVSLFASVPVSYIGLYLDETHALTYHFYSTAFEEFDVWVWLYPSERGLNGLEYSLDVPEWIAYSQRIDNPILPGSFSCDESYGCQIVLDDCQNDWVWVQKHIVYPTEDLMEGYIVIKDDNTYPFITNCLEGRPVENIAILTRILINKIDSNEDTSWSVMKRLVK